jgi:hypothetical protein
MVGYKILCQVFKERNPIRIHNVNHFVEDICVWKWEAERTTKREKKYEVFTSLMQ